MNWLYKCGYYSAKWALRLFYRHHVYGLERSYPDAAIIACNHASYLDPLIAGVSFPKAIHYLAKKSLFDSPLFGWIIRRLNAHPIRGGAQNVSAIKMVGSLIEEKKKVLIFPEGTRSKDGELQPVQPGIGMLLLHYKCCVIPTYIHGSYEIWKPSKRFPKLLGRTACIFGTPIYWDEFDKLEKKEAQKAVVNRIETALLDLKNWYEAGAIGTPP